MEEYDHQKNIIRTRFRFIVLTTAAIVAIAFFSSVRAVAPQGGMREVIIEKGESVREIAIALHKAELIRSPNAFRLVSVLYGAAHALKPGRYLLSQASSTSAIVKALVAGPMDERVLVVEGETVKEIEEDLVGRHMIAVGTLHALTPAAFENEYPFLKGASSFEGFLFPDTYHLSYGMEPKAILRVFLDAFAKKAWPLLLKRANWYDLLITASLVEKEVVGREERRLVAGIIAKRLALAMPLQIDATVEYAKCGTFRNCFLTRSDYALASPFNTYLHAGLSPAPIDNPGLDAIRAALDPKSSPYLYYLTDPKTKRAYFSATLDEHNQKRAKYLGL